MDRSNIYNLPDIELEKYKEIPFPDDEIRPGLINFAEKFKKEIINFSTPNVIALEGGYGTGKTYFTTRFCEYLKKINYEKDEKINSVYINLWESDYIQDPFIIITNKILNELNLKNKEEIKQILLKIFKGSIKFLLKQININIDDDINELFISLNNRKDSLKEFKYLLQESIKDIGKVVLIVDELDRCKPDYAVKTLEIIKHFFDIDGLLIILNTKIDFLNNIFEAYYGHPQCDTFMGEGYIQKFIQSKKILNPTTIDDYMFIIDRIINKDNLPPRINPFNYYYEKNLEFIKVFINNLANIFNSNQFSIRKTIDISNEILRIIDTYKFNIWIDKPSLYPEWVIINFLKEKNIISKDTEEPEVDSFFPIGEEEKKRILKIII